MGNVVKGRDRINSEIRIFPFPRSNALLCRADELVEVRETSRPLDGTRSLKTDKSQVGQWYENMERKREYYRIIIFSERTWNVPLYEIPQWPCTENLQSNAITDSRLLTWQLLQPVDNPLQRETLYHLTAMNDAPSQLSFYTMKRVNAAWVKLPVKLSTVTDALISGRYYINELHIWHIPLFLISPFYKIVVIGK